MILKADISFVLLVLFACLVSVEKLIMAKLILNNYSPKAKLRGSLPKSVPLNFGLEKLLPYNFTINTTIHPSNEIAVRMRKLLILLPFPAFHRWSTVGG